MALLDLSPTIIRGPQGDELVRVRAAFQEAGCPGTLGVIDGSYVPIAQSKEFARSYICRKGFAAIILQGVCDDTLNIQ